MPLVREPELGISGQEQRTDVRAREERDGPGVDGDVLRAREEHEHHADTGEQQEAAALHDGGRRAKPLFDHEREREQTRAQQVLHRDQPAHMHAIA